MQAKHRSGSHTTFSGELMHGIRAVGGARSAVAVAAALIVACLVGCGDSTKSAITGKVTYKSAPVTGGTIAVTPASAASSPFIVAINPDGTFLTNDIPPGKYQVAVSTDNVAPAAAP